MEDYGQYRYGMLENAGHWFPGKKGIAVLIVVTVYPAVPNNCLFSPY